VASAPGIIGLPYAHQYHSTGSPGASRMWIDRIGTLIGTCARYCTPEGDADISSKALFCLICFPEPHSR
jgi:hypothetical protein